MNIQGITALATPIAVIIAAVVERLSANRIKRELKEVHELVNSRLTAALNEIIMLKASALVMEKQEVLATLARIESLILNAKVKPLKEDGSPL